MRPLGLIIVSAVGLIGAVVVAIGVGRAITEQRDDEAKASVSLEDQIAKAVEKVKKEETAEDKRGNFWEGMGEFFGQVDDAVVRVATMLI